MNLYNLTTAQGAGDLWYFPPGVPHSLQATADNPAGTEFLLVFDDGSFSEDATFLVSLQSSNICKITSDNHAADRLVGACAQGSPREELPDR